MSDASDEESSSSVGVLSDDSSDEWSCSSHSFDDPILGDDENMTVQPYQFEPELDEEEEDQEISVGNDQDRTRNTLTQA